MSVTKTVAVAAVALAVVGTCLLMAQRRGTLGNQPIAKDDGERLILEVSSQAPRRMNVPMEDGRLIRTLTEAIGAKHAVEIGTSTGYSGLWFAMGLRSTGGKLTTFEIEPDVAATAREIFTKAGVSDIITVVVGDAHETVSQLEGPIDIVFIDAEKPGYRDYLDKILPMVRPGGLILAHNIRTASDNTGTSKPSPPILIWKRRSFWAGTGSVMKPSLCWPAILLSAGLRWRLRPTPVTGS